MNLRGWTRRFGDYCQIGLPFSLPNKRGSPPYSISRAKDGISTVESCFYVDYLNRVAVVRDRLINLHELYRSDVDLVGLVVHLAYEVETQVAEPVRQLGTLEIMSSSQPTVVIISLPAGASSAITAA